MNTEVVWNDLDRQYCLILSLRFDLQLTSRVFQLRVQPIGNDIYFSLVVYSKYHQTQRIKHITTSKVAMSPNHLHQKRLMITLQQLLFYGDTHTPHKKFGLPLIVQSSQENLLQKSDLMRSLQQILICRYSNAYQKTWCFCIRCIVCTIKQRHLMKKTI